MRADVDPLMSALAAPTRRRVVQLLGDGPMRAGKLAEVAGLSAPAMSRHLRILLVAGLIEDERRPEDARLRMFRLRENGLVDLRAWLDELHDRWEAQLDSFKRHADRT